MPDITCNLIWVDERVYLSGPLSRGRPSMFTGREIQLLAIEPWALGGWLGVPIDLFADRMTLLADVDARRAAWLAEIFNAGRAAELTKVEHVSNSERARRTFAAAVLLRRGGRVATAAAAVELSGRQLTRLFIEDTGLAPRSYAQIARLRRAVQAAKAGDALADAAADAGYADQPHFTRAVRALTGLKPRRLIAHVGNVQDMQVGRW